MCEKFYNTNCYWHEDIQDMNATLLWCNYFHQPLNGNRCNKKCKAYISQEECNRLIKKAIENKSKENNNKNLNLIKQALIAYDIGEIFECRDILEEVIKSINEFENNTLDYINQYILNQNPVGEDIAK